MSERPDRPGPMRRRGPRPLMLHLTGATPSSPGCSPAWMSWNAGQGPCLNPAPPTPAELPDPAILRGIAAYRRHLWERTLPDPPALWAEGPARLLDYAGAGPVVLFVPSLINRGYILDLMPDVSMLRWLAASGLRPLLLDWGWPGTVERQFTLTDYVAGPLERAMCAAAGTANGTVLLAGYCMGGLLAMGAAMRRPELVRGLALLATPWDFHAGGHDDALRLAAALPALGPLLQATGTLPVDTLQTLFASVSPGAIGAKFRAFGTTDQASPAAERFVALEDWLNDGVPLAAPVARETIGGWYGQNTPARGEWRIAGEAVQPSRIRMPTFIAAPGQDRIVPPASAVALAAAIEGAVLHRPNSGHIGMVAGPRAPAALWKPLLDWFRSL